jgi:hypothetical protein
MLWPYGALAYVIYVIARGDETQPGIEMKGAILTALTICYFISVQRLDDGETFYQAALPATLAAAVGVWLARWTWGPHGRPVEAAHRTGDRELHGATKIYVLPLDGPDDRDWIASAIMDELPHPSPLEIVENVDDADLVLQVAGCKSHSPAVVALKFPETAMHTVGTWAGATAVDRFLAAWAKQNRHLLPAKKTAGALLLEAVRRQKRSA